MSQPMMTPEQVVVSEAFQVLGNEIASLRGRIEELERRDAEREQQLATQAKKHDDLVQEIQTLLNQAMAIDPQRAQAIKARAIRIARHRNIQQNGAQ